MLWVLMLGAVLLGVSLVVDVSMLRVLVAAILAAAIVIAASPIREAVLLAWVFLAPYWQEVARTTPLGTALNNGAYLFAGVGVVLWAMGLVLHRASSGRIRLRDMLAGIFLFWTLGSLLLGDLLPSGWTKTDMVRQWYGNLVLPISGFYVMWWGVREEFVTRWFAAVWTTSIGVSLLTIAERWFGYQLWPYYRWQSVDIGRAVGPLANPAVLGTVLGIGIAAAAAYIVWSRESARLTRLAWACIIVALPALWYTYARASLLAVLVAVALIAAFKSEARFTLTGVVVLSALLVVSFWGSVGQSAVVNERLGNVSNAQVRVLLAAWSLELVSQRPLVGWGYGSFDVAKGYASGAIAEIPTAFAAGDTSHNTLLTFFVELGFLGVIPLILAVMMPLSAGVRRLAHGLSRDWRLFASVGGVGVFTINAAFIDMRFFSFPALIAWMLLGVLSLLLERSSEPVDIEDQE